MTTDLSNLSWSAMESTLYLAGLTGAQVTVLTVIKPTAPPTTNDRLEMARRFVQTSLEQLKGEVPVMIEVSQGTSVADEIVATAIRLKADLVVLATRGTTGRSTVLLGSVAAEVVARSPIPVLTVHANQQSLNRRTSRPKLEPKHPELWTG